MSIDHRIRKGRVLRCGGLTLIELMVAMLLSLVLLSGVLTIFAGGKATSGLQRGLATVQENGRHALYLLVRDIRGAGFSGCAGISPTIINIIADDAPDGISAFTDDEVLFGLDDVAASNPYNAAAGTDVVRVRGAGDGLVGLVGNTVPVNANIQTTVARDFFEAEDLLVITDCEAMDIFRATSVSQSGTKSTIAHSQSMNSSNNLSRPYDKDAFVLKFRSNTYFIRDTGRTNSSGGTVRALYRRDYNDVDTELVDGVEDMQVLYGVDGDGNGHVDRFMDGDAVQTAALWANVKAVKISLLVNSVDNSSEVPASYTFVGTTSTPTDPADLRLRQEFAATVTIRNRVD